MALSPQLANFKSSGVYRLEFDKSITASFNSQTIRLVVGHSKKGPYNTPVLCQTIEEFQGIFGNIDLNLESTGMFFHRSAQNALSRGAILALNIANIDSNDLIAYQSPVTFGSNPGTVTLHSESGTKPFEEFYNTDKFWFPEDIEVINAIGQDTDRVLNFINIKQDPITIIVRKAQNVAQFDITAREWYGNGNVPAYLNDFDYISDFMVDVFVFKGEFDPATLNSDPVYGAYFTNEGLITDQLSNFSNLRQVSLLAQYTGSLLAGFKDLEGNDLYVETMINGESSRTGLFCAVNAALVTSSTGTAVDLIGHVYDKDQDYELLSYLIDSNVTSNDIVLPSKADNGGVAVTTSIVTTLNTNDTLHINNYDATGVIQVGDLFLKAGLTNEYAEIIHTEFTAGVTIIQCSEAINSIYGGIDTTGGSHTIYTYNINIPKYPQYDFVAGPVTGTYAAIGNGQFTATFDMTGHYGTPINFPIKKGNYVNSAVAGRLAKVLRVSSVTAGSITTYTVTCDRDAAASWPGNYVLSFEDATTVYKPFILSAALVSAKTISGVLSQLVGTNLYDALIDKDLIDYRYVVDTFASFDASVGILNKQELSYLASQRQNVSAILNAPTVADFKKSTNPSFKDANGTFQTQYVADGGNLDMNPTNFYALPSINNGANYAFYYGPGLTVTENGKSFTVPPAAYVSNNYIDKYFNALPWSIVAGPRRGVVSGINVTGVEYPFSKADRDILEPFGINPIVFQRGVGSVITGNKTGQQSVKSALSSAHVREVLIYIEEGLAKILKNYVFEFNTAQTRLEIKTLADSFMTGLKADNGVYDFKNVMDQTNNTQDVIDNNMGILDTFVEPVKGLEIIVQRTTVLNTGAISTGNFS